MPRGERGAAMLAALCLAMVFAISLSSYIALCFTSLAMSTRNVVNDHCLELAESGVEQALYASNGNALGVSSAMTGWTSSPGSLVTTVTTTMTMTTSGLEPSSGSPTPLNFGNGATGQANITFTYLNGQPMAIQSITSQGVITLPAGTIIGGATPIVSRTLSYSGSGASGTAAAPVFVNAVAATSGPVTFSAAGTLDSFNSNPSPGVYQAYSTAVAGYSAVVASQDVTSFSPTVQLNDAVVNGYVIGYAFSSPATDNWLSYAASGKLEGPLTPVATFIDSSRILTSPVPYQPVFPQNLPSALNPLPAGCTSGGNILNIASSIGNSGSSTPLIYNANGINLTTGTLSVVGPVVLVVNGPGSGTAMNISGAGGIQLTTAQASLTIFVTGGSVALGGAGITNSNSIPTTGIPPLAKRVALLSTTSTGYTVTMSENQPFYGVVYFPNQPITISSSSVIYGSVVGSSVTVSSSPTIHYDNALRLPDSQTSDAAFASIAAPITVSSLLASVP
jgi:hypothetical protein